MCIQNILFLVGCMHYVLFEEVDLAKTKMPFAQFCSQEYFTSEIRVSLSVRVSTFENSQRQDGSASFTRACLILFIALLIVIL
jgi:hypothetical protein